MAKTMKKKILMVLCTLLAVASIVVASVYGTLAYLTASSKVSNTFTVGNVYLEMFESKVDENGQRIGDGTAKKTSDGNSYKLVPGTTYCKDPTIYIQAGSEASYLFVLVRNDIRSIEDPSNTMRQQMIAKGWREYTYAAPSTGTYAWVYCGTGGGNTPVGVAGGPDGAKIDLFETFTIDENADVSLYGGAGVTLTAIGIQTAGFGEVGTDAAVNAAWDAVINTYPFIYDIHHDTSTTTAVANP